MKKLAVLALVTLFSMSAFAQEKTKKTPEERATKLTEKMTKKLDLTAEQAAKVKQINLDAATKKQTLKAANKGKRKEIREQVKAIETDRSTQINLVLTDDQKVKYAKMEKHAKKKMKARRGKRKGKRKGGADVGDEG